MKRTLHKSLYKVVALLLGTTLLTACFGDLDTLPRDNNQLVSEQVYSTKEGYTGVLAKCYASLVLTGQQGGDGGDGDLEGANEGYSGYIRVLFYLQELCTDNFLMPSSSNGLRMMLNMTWDESNAAVIKWTYQRLYMSIAYCDELLRECTEEKLQERGLWEEMKEDYSYYRAEVRLIRAYAYTMLCDLFGGVPFVDEHTGIKEIPVQMSRKELFNYIVQEANEIEEALKAPGQNVYGRVDRVSLWFLLSRLYLNAEVFIGENHYQKAYEYAKRVIDSGAYPLATDYRHIFLADNNKCSEIIWPLVQDGMRAQSSAGTNFYVKGFVNGAMDELYQTGIGSKGWGNVRAKTNLVDAFDASDVLFNANDTWGDNKMDKRAQFMTALPDQTKETWDSNNAMTNTFTCGYGYIKWRNVTQADEICASGDVYTSIDFPLFRTGEAYLTAAEAILRGANASSSEALDLVNEIRMRAYMSDSYSQPNVRSDVSGKISANELTLDFILAERQRELASELVRRTDLVRYNKLTQNNHFDWKGGERLGMDVDTKYNIFPIPDSELTNNPSLIQNEGYGRP